MGWFEVFLHKKDSSVAASSEPFSGALGAASPNLRADMLAAVPPPADRIFFDVGETVTFNGRVFNESDHSVRSIGVLFFDGDPVRDGKAFAMKTIPGVLPGSGYSVEIRHAFSTPGPREVHMRISPKFGETTHHDNTARILVPVRGEGGSSGGCSTGAVGGTALLLLAGLIPLATRRNTRG